MENVKKENRKFNVKFDSYVIGLAANLIDKLTSTMEVVYYLMERGDETSFVLVLLSAENVEMEKLLTNQKRATDILFEIEAESNLYAVICQDTKIDGGYHFANRVVGDIKLLEGRENYCAELEVRSTAYDIKYVIFKLLETYNQAREEKKAGEIIFKTLN